ncbi:MAG: ABC transporter substrate-binding protein [Fimbriimonas sp.]
MGWVVGVLLLAGCDNSPYPPEPPGKRVLHLSLRDEPNTLDPAAALSPAIVDLIYPAYFEYDYLRRDPVPLNLAVGAMPPKIEPWRLPDGRMGERWTFRIKPGLRFQDDPCFPDGRGREIRANDVLFALKRLADPAVSAPYFSYVEGRILGMAAYAKANGERLKRKLPADFDADVPGLQADPHDPYTFRIVLTEPFPQLKYIMALRCTSPQAREAWDRYGKELRRHPVGSGPFRLKEYLPKQRIVLEANPNRRREFYPTVGAPGDREAGLLKDAGKPLPRSDEIVYSIVRESISSWNRFLQGYEDAWGVNQTNYQTVMAGPGELSPEMRANGVRLLRTGIPNVIGFVFNMDDPTFGGYAPGQRKLRQAISLAIDRQEIVDLFSQGNSLPAEFLVPPAITGYDPKYRNPYSGRDLAKAKRLLAEAGFPGGKDRRTGERLKLYYDNNAQDALGRQYVGLVRRQISALGIDVVGRSWRPVVMADRQEKGQWQFAAFDWYADYPDPEMFLLMLYSPNKRPGMNRTNYRNPEVDRLFERIRIMDDGPERQRLVHRLRDLAVEDCPWVYVEHRRALAVGHSWMKNRKMGQVDADLSKYWSVDPEERARRVREWNRPRLAPLGIGVGLFVLGTIPAALGLRKRARTTARQRGARR